MLIDNGQVIYDGGKEHKLYLRWKKLDREEDIRELTGQEQYEKEQIEKAFGVLN